MRFFKVILLAALPVTLGIPMMFTACYFQENDFGTRVDVGPYLVIFTAGRVTIIP